MEQLKQERVWAIWDGHRNQFVGLDGEPATADNLTTFALASERISWLARDQWPPPYSLAVSLDAAGLICIDLYGAWDRLRDTPIEGAWTWLAACNSYAERCHEAADGERAIRIIARGRVPDGARIPPRVRITTAGLVTVTTERIPSRPSYRVDNFRLLPEDNDGIIRDCTEALAELLVPKRQKYFAI